MVVRISNRISDTITDGPGLRYAVYVQGCNLDCAGCHNPQTHDANGGYDMAVSDIVSEISANPLLDGLTISGGEPFLQVKPLTELARSVRTMGLNVWVYSGYTYEQILDDTAKRPLLEQTDVLVDGPFELSQRSLNLLWRGSANQRVLDVKACLSEGKPVWFV
jgi:anaerobic ribonucleoside-triphosphate reductase activating protein